MLPASVRDELERCPHELLFVTVSGAHLYGFESADSDWDLRGAFVQPIEDVLSLGAVSETFEVMNKDVRPEVDIVAHACRKYFGMLLKSNGYVLEQVFSPIVARCASEFEELRAIARTCISKRHRHHFFHFGVDQWKAAASAATPTVKGLLYTYRPLLAGIHLMQTGEIESNLRVLNDEFRIPEINGLIDRKVEGSERMAISPSELESHRPIFDSLCLRLDQARDASHLPDEPQGADALNDLLFRIQISRAMGSPRALEAMR